jgi:DNA-binding response OmpR family regulator
MVVDDEPAIVRLVRAKLQADGYAVITASRGEEALDLLEDDRPDLVVLDLMMPGMDGFETLRRIREIGQIPVMMLTARAGDADKVRGLQGGADDYLTKPFNPDELSARVAAILRRTAGAAPAGGRSISSGGGWSSAAKRCASAGPNGSCSPSSAPTPAASCSTASCFPAFGARNSGTSRTTCGRGSAACAPSSNLSRTRHR